MRRRIDEKLVEKKSGQVPPRFELGSLDSKSRVLTITPWNLLLVDRLYQFLFLEDKTRINNTSIRLKKKSPGSTEI